MQLIRRDFLLGAFSLLSPPIARAHESNGIAQIEKALGGRVGVSALNTANGVRIRYRADERFAMCSTFKAALAAAILVRVDHGELTLNQQMKFTQSDLLSNAPVTSAHMGDGALSIEELCAAAVEVSDNTAANLLLSLIGGPAGLTAFFRSIGDKISRLDRIELELNSNLPNDPRDTTTPEAMEGVLKALLIENKVLSTKARERLTDWMLKEQNGRSSIGAGLPPDWRVANKPGTSAESAGATNDIAVVWPPGRAPIIISIYVDARETTLEKRTKAIADVTRLVPSLIGS